MPKDFEIGISKYEMQTFRMGLKRLDKELTGTSDKVLEKTALKILSQSIVNLKENKSIASGKLVKNGRFKKKEKDHIYEVVYTGYAGAVEFGRRAGKMPPLKIIQQWIRRKGIAKIDMKGFSKNKKSKFIESIAYLIARKIGAEGTKEKPFLAPAFERHIRKLINKLTNELNKKIDKF